MNRNRKFSIKSRIIGIMLLCWFVPLILIVGINGYYLYSNHFDNKISKELERLKFNDQISVERLDRAIQASRKVSYDGQIISLYESYEKGKIPANQFLSESSYYLSTQYRTDESIKGAILWYKKAPATLHESAYNDSVGGSYKQISTYWEQDHEAVQALAETLDTKIGFYNKDNRLYLVRNILNSSYTEAGTLVLLLNQDYCFNNYASFPADTSVTLAVDGQKIQLSGDKVSRKETGINKLSGSAGYHWDGNKLRLFHRVDTGEYTFSALIRFDDSSAFELFYGYRYILFGMLMLLVPLLMTLLRVFKKHITQPIENLMRGAQEIEEGNLGYQLGDEPESKEFQYLADSFNEMSGKLKIQFDHIYEEELALRDAKIMALQSHINPHFMNNTLEIINWEARMSGNQKVSQMIEALATLMDATIDRKKQPEVLLSEEMMYVNAYLYIISERFGKRLTIHKDLPEEIMEYKVPRLILQPVIENAVEHGAVKSGQGSVTITGYKKGAFLYLEITNEAVLTKEDEAKIKRLLDFDYDTSKEPSGSLGIANVNQRLRILYGEPCGLTMQKLEKNQVLTRLTILVEKDHKIMQEITD